MQSSFTCTGSFADCLDDSDYTQQPRISLDGSAFTAATHLSLLLLRIHQFPLPQEQGISKVHQAGIYFSSVCHWQKPRCPCLSGQCPSLCQTDSWPLAAAQALCFYSSQFHSCAVLGMVSCMLCLYTQFKFKIPYYWCFACLHMENHKDTHSHVQQATRVCILLQTAALLSVAIHARQSHLSQYLPGKVISVIQNPCMLQHAPVAECGAEYPLVIFSHGIGGNRIAYSAIICSLVRQVHPSFQLPP